MQKLVSFNEEEAKEQEEKEVKAVEVDEDDRSWYIYEVGTCAVFSPIFSEIVFYLIIFKRVFVVSVICI